MHIYISFLGFYRFYKDCKLRLLLLSTDTILFKFIKMIKFSRLSAPMYSDEQDYKTPWKLLWQTLNIVFILNSILYNTQPFILLLLSEIKPILEEIFNLHKNNTISFTRKYKTLS